MRRFQATLFLLCVFPLSDRSGEVCAADQGKPNVVFILADDLGYRELGSFGQQLIRTPNLDALAKQGMRLTQHYSGNAVCAPSRCVLMTGKHPGHAFVRANKSTPPEGQQEIPADEITLAELMGQQGYVTGAFGKWGLGGPDSTGAPLRQGVDRFFGYNCQAHAHSYYPSYLWDDDQHIVLDNNPPVPGHASLAKGADKSDPASYDIFKGQDYAPDRINAAALDFVRDNKDRPFFLYYPTVIPHVALHVPDEDLKPYLDLGWNDPPFTRGKGYGYTNCSSDMAGRITEVIRGKSWDDVLLEQVIKPMSLTQTDSLYERLVCHPLAVGHTGTRDKPELLPFWGLYRGHAPAGSTVCASASDMVRFGSLFLNRVDGVLGADTIKLMMEKQVDTPTKFMAHGWCLGPYYKVWDGVEIWGHSGTNLGGSSTLLWIPEKDAAVAVTSNHATQGYPLAAFCFREILGEFGIEMPAKFEPVASDENISKHVGQYQAHQVTIDITQGDDETLHAKKTTRQFNETVIESDLKPLGNGRFLVLDPVFSGNRDWDVAFWDDCLTDGVFTLKKA